MSVVANVAINVDSRGAVSKLRQVQTQSQQTERAVEGLSRAFGGLAAAFGAGFALTKVIADVKELDTNLRRLGTVGVDVAKISPALSKLSDELGGVASKAELAAASYQAASAGFSDTAGNINILRAATKAAVGGLADTQAVTEVLVKTLNSYGLAGDQAAEVTDSISKAVELGNQEWSDYTSQLGRVASIAALVGVSVDELNAFISSATLNGATAETAFTGLGATLSQIITPTKESQEAAAKLGIAWNYGGLQAKGFSGLMAELAIAMKKDKEAASRMVGPIEAARGAFAAASKDGSDFKNILEQIGGAAGKTDADFQTMKGSLENTLKALDTSFKNLSEALGTAFGPTVVIVVQDITKAVNGFADFMATVPQPVMNTAGELAKLVAQILLLDKALKIAIATAALFRGAMLLLTTQTTLAGAAALTGQARLLMLSGGIKGAGVAAATATPALVGLLGVLLRLAAIGAIAIVVNVAVTGMAALLQASAEIAKLRGQRNQPGGAAGDFGGSITPQQRKENEKTLDAIRRERQSPEFKGQQASAALGIGKTAYNLRVAQLQEREIAARARLALPNTPATPTTPKPTPTPTPTTATGDGTGKGTGAKKERESQLADILAANGLFRSQETIAARIAVAEVDQNKAEVARLQNIDRSVQLLYEAAAIERSNIPLDEKQAQLRGVQDKLAASTNQYEREIATEKIAQVKAGSEQLQKMQDEQALLQGRLAGNEAEVMLNQQIRDLKKEFPTLDEAAIKTTLQQTEALKKQVEAAEQMKQVYADIGMSIKDGVVGAIQGAIDGTKSLQEVASDLLSNIANKLLDVAVNLALFGAMSGTGTGGGLLGGLFKENAKGNVYAKSGIQPFAKGGIVNKPTMFPFAKGIGLMGEAGPEAIMPLTRGPSGQLGVSNFGGGGDVNVVVNVDAKGSSVEGNEQGANQLGRVISAAVQSELIKQQRPGGILAR